MVLQYRFNFRSLRTFHDHDGIRVTRPHRGLLSRIVLHRAAYPLGASVLDRPPTQACKGPPTFFKLM